MSTLANVKENEFQDTVLDRKGLTLVDFWAEWCGPCKMLTPTLEQVQNEMGDQVKIVKVNIEDNPGVASQFRITNIPLMILFKDGKQAGQLLGNQPKKRIVELIESNQ